MKEKGFLQLDDSLESFFEKCHVVNDLLETKGLFLRVYERRNEIRYLIKKEQMVKMMSPMICHPVLSRNLMDMKY